MKVSGQDAAGNDLVTGRIALGLAYKGTNYYGWQTQSEDLPCVQEKLEEALSRVANHDVSVVCAGRTDKAVHATHQVVHFDTSSRRTERSWVFGCNANLPKDISVSWAKPVDMNFHARFSAVSRRYHYFIYNHPIRPAHFYEELTWFHYPLDEHRMNEAAQALVGEHDFTSFRAVGCQSKTPFRFIEHVKIQRFGDVLLLDIKGNAFLHHMVRNIAGVLLEIGSGNRAVNWCKDVLEARDRTQAAVTAPPFGLFLVDATYPDEFALPKSIGAPSFARAMMNAGAATSPLDSDMWNISRLNRD